MAITTLTKQPAESRLYSMDFSPLLADALTVSSVTSVTVAPSGPTLSGAATVNGVYAYQRILGGTAGVTYKVTFVVVDSAGNILEGEGMLVVRDL